MLIDEKDNAVLMDLGSVDVARHSIANRRDVRSDYHTFQLMVGAAAARLLRRDGDCAV